MSGTDAANVLTMFRYPIDVAVYGHLINRSSSGHPWPRRRNSRPLPESGNLEFQRQSLLPTG